jgi:hypothetical protein
MVIIGKVALFLFVLSGMNVHDFFILDAPEVEPFTANWGRIWNLFTLSVSNFKEFWPLLSKVLQKSPDLVKIPPFSFPS